MSGAVFSVVAGDYDNDGDTDLYFVMGQGIPEGTEVEPNRVLFRFVAGTADTIKQVHLRAAGTLAPTILIEGRIDRERVFLGQDAFSWSKSEWQGALDDPILGAAPKLTAESPRGVYLWRDETGELVLRFLGDTSSMFETSGWIDCSDGCEVTHEEGIERRNRPRPNRLLQNTGGEFKDVTEEAGVGDTGPGVDALFADLDNDGFVDLYVVNGGDAFHNSTNRLYRNLGDGTFQEVTEAVPELRGPTEGRSASVLAFDYDLDGDLDLFSTNGHGPRPRNVGPYSLWRNDSSTGHWLTVALTGRKSNRQGLGARVEVQAAQRRSEHQLLATTGRFSTSSLPLHVGLGTDTEARVVIHWPAGGVQEVLATAGSRVRVVEK